MLYHNLITRHHMLTFSANLYNFNLILPAFLINVNNHLIYNHLTTFIKIIIIHIIVVNNLYNNI